MHHSQFGGISLYGLVTGSSIGANKIAGDSAFALQANQGFFNPADLSSSNRFLGNDISQFTSSVANAFLGPNTLDNIVLGNCGSLIDLGAGNFVTCGTLTTGNPNGAASAAGAQKQQILQRLMSSFSVARTMILAP